MTETTTQVERVARAIATANGDNFADAFTNKSRWIAKRGMSGGRYRDVNEPFKDDYLEMATAAIKAMSDAEPVAWKCQERTMGAWHIRYVDERPTGERYRNIAPLYVHPPAAEPVGLREAVEGIDDDYMTSEKHHPGYVLIPTAKFEQIVSAAERAKEIVPSYYVNWHHDADKALATPARTDDAEQMAAALSPPLS